MDKITLLVCNKLNNHDKDGPILINNFNTEWNTIDYVKCTFTSEWHNKWKEVAKTEYAGLGLGIYREDFNNFHKICEKSDDILGKLHIQEQECRIEFNFYTKHNNNITKKKDVIDGEEVISITLNSVYECLINIEFKHRSSSGTLSEFNSTEIIPVSVAEKILHTNSIDEVLKIIKENIKEKENKKMPNKTIKLKKLNDPVSHPSHYTDGKIEVIDYIEDKKLGFHLGNAVKYISRAGKKDPNKYVEDLKKAVWYINREIERETNPEKDHDDSDEAVAILDDNELKLDIDNTEAILVKKNE